MGEFDLIQFNSNMEEAELLCGRNLALDQRRAFSVFTDKRVSNSSRFCATDCALANVGFPICNLYNLSSSVVSVYIWCHCSLFFLEAMLISRPLRTTLWATHRVLGDISGVAFSIKYSWIAVEISCLVMGSASRESFKRQE